MCVFPRLVFISTDCFDICHTSLNKQMLKCSSETIRKKIFFVSPEIFSIQEIDILYWQFYKTDVNVLKFLAYLIQFNLIKPNCPLKCRYEKCLVVRLWFADLHIILSLSQKYQKFKFPPSTHSSRELFQEQYKCFLFQLTINIWRNIFGPPLLTIAAAAENCWVFGFWNLLSGEKCEHWAPLVNIEIISDVKFWN